MAGVGGWPSTPPTDRLSGGVAGLEAEAHREDGPCRVHSRADVGEYDAHANGVVPRWWAGWSESPSVGGCHTRGPATELHPTERPDRHLRGDETVPPPSGPVVERYGPGVEVAWCSH